VTRLGANIWRTSAGILFPPSLSKGEGNPQIQSISKVVGRLSMPNGFDSRAAQLLSG
jgi:hypothetical protein